MMKCLRIKFKNDKTFDLTVDQIAVSRAHYYQKQYNKSYQDLYLESLNAFSNYECLLEHWVNSKMDVREIQEIGQKYGLNFSENDWKTSLREISDTKQ